MFTNAEAKYAANWNLSSYRKPTESPLPLVPVVARGDILSGNPLNLYTLFRATTQTGSIVVYGGCNVHHIPTFCGGQFATAFNVHARTFTREHGAWNAPDVPYSDVERAPLVDDFLGPNWNEWAQAAYSPIDDHFPNTAVFGFAGYDQAGVNLARIVAVSIMARLYLYGGAGNQNLTHFWDRTHGCTAKFSRWGYLALQNKGLITNWMYARGAFSPHARWGHYNANGSLPAEELMGRIDGSPERVNIFPTEYEVAVERTNYNSGSTVGAIITQADRGHKMGATYIKAVGHPDWIPMFCGPHIHTVALIRSTWSPQG